MAHVDQDSKENHHTKKGGDHHSKKC